MKVGRAQLFRKWMMKKFVIFIVSYPVKSTDDATDVSRSFSALSGNNTHNQVPQTTILVVISQLPIILVVEAADCRRQ